MARDCLFGVNAAGNPRWAASLRGRALISFAGKPVGEDLVGCEEK